MYGNFHKNSMALLSSENPLDHFAIQSDENPIISKAPTTSPMNLHCILHLYLFTIIVLSIGKL